MENIYDKLEIPDARRDTSITKQEAEYIYQFLSEKKINTSLEVGFAFGCSTAHIMAATNSTHYTIDPFQKEDFGDLGLKNINALGYSKLLKFENDYSHSVLPKLLKEEVKLDFAFIDGGHNFDSIFIDFYYVDLLLNNNGWVLLHDTWMRSTQYAFSWIKRNKKNYKEIKTPVKNFILLQKIGEDNRTWFHFKGFCTFKSMYSNWKFSFKQ